MPNKEKQDLEDFLSKADKAHELVSKLRSGDLDVVKKTQDEIDHILDNDWEEEDSEFKTKDGFSKSSVSKIEDNPVGAPGGFESCPSDQAGFMKMVEEDANKRAENRRRKEDKSKIRREKGNEAFKAGDYNKAIEEYDIAIKLTGWIVSLYTNKAQCLIRMKEFDKAIAECDRAIYIEEDFAKAYIQKSNALIAKESYKDAVACLEECLKCCKNTEPVVKKYLEKANMLLLIKEDNENIMKEVAEKDRKEFQHFLSKLKSKKAFEATISSELLLKSLTISSVNIRLFRALGGIEAINQQLLRHKEHALHINLFSLLKEVLTADKLSLYHWIYTLPAASLVAHIDNAQYRMLLLLLLQRLTFWDDEEKVNVFLDSWVDPRLTEAFFSCYHEKTTKAMTVLILGRAIRNNNFLVRNKGDVVKTIQAVSDYIPYLVEDDISEQKTWIGGLSGLSMIPLARRLLDKSFWSIFIHLLDFLVTQQKDSMIDDLLATGQNFALDSVALADRGVGISSKLVEMCGETKYKRAPLLLNRVLERCPNSLLAEDKGQFAALLKVIKGQADLQDESLSTAVKLLARTTAVSTQARKWVVKYDILAKLVDLLDGNYLTKDSSKTATAILSNAALCCAHCFQDEAVCKRQSPDLVDVFLKHAKADKGLVIQQNAAIGLARLATNNPLLLERLREKRGLEILHSRFSLPDN